MTLTDRLRQRVYASLGDRTYSEAATEIGISRMALWRFLKGGDSKAATLDAIEAWLARNVTSKGQR